MYLKRITEVLRGEDWVTTTFEDLKKDDIFRLFDPPEHKPVTWQYVMNGQTKFKAYSDPFLNEDLIWTIECDEVEE